MDADDRFVEKGDDSKCNKDNNLGSDEEDSKKAAHWQARDGYLNLKTVL